MSFARSKLMEPKLEAPVRQPPSVAAQDPMPPEGIGVDTASERGPGPLSALAYRAMLQRYALLIVMALLIVVFSALRPATFFTVNDLTTILGTEAPAALLVLGVTVVLLVGEFDLSVASTMGLSASLVAALTTQQHVSAPVACLAVLTCSLLVGLLNAFFVVRVGVNSFIVTLGVGTLVEGIGLGLVGATTIGGLPTSFTGAFQHQLGGVQLPFFYVLVIAILFYVVVGRMPLGRSLFFTGNAREAAALAGIRTDRLRAGSFMASSLVAGAAGILLAGQTGAASPTITSPYLLPAYAAAFLGATAFTIGRFNIWGSLWAVYLLAVGTTGFELLGVQNWVIDFFDGGVLVVAVVVAKVFSFQGRRRRLRATSRQRQAQSIT